MKFSWTNCTVTNTQKVKPHTYACVFWKACHAAACLLIYSSHPQSFIHWASANIGALHVQRLMKNKAPVAAAALHPPPVLWETTEGQQNYTPAPLSVHRFPRMRLGIQSLLILLTYEWPQRILVQIRCVCGRVKMWNDKKQKQTKKKKTLLYVINRRYTQQSCVTIQLWDVSRWRVNVSLMWWFTTLLLLFHL